MLRLILLEAGLDIKVSIDEKNNMTITASKGELTIDEIREWIKKHLIKLDL